MNKAKKYIKDFTNHCSNKLIFGDNAPWLSPENALRAAEIANEEATEKACKCYCDDICEKGMSNMCFHKHDGKGQVKRAFKYCECNELKMLREAMKK